MAEALYGSKGFFTRPAEGPADHFRTSVHASPLMANALLRLIRRVDEQLGFPARFEVVDVGAGRGELLAALHALLDDDPASREQAPGEPPGPHSAPGAGRPHPRALRERVRFIGVEVAARPEGLPSDVWWQREIPEDIVGLLLATEWLDNVPLDVAEVGSDGRVRRVLVDPATGLEAAGGEIDAADRFWIARWWPGAGLGDRIEIGWPRDVAWADAVGCVRRGCALAVDYGHLRGQRPQFGTLTGYRDGRQVSPVPDGTSDVTAHVALDAVAVAAGTPYKISSQREALRGLGVDGGRPPLDLARTDPAGYLRALSAAGAAAELTDPDGLGGHWWLLHEVGLASRGTIVP